MDYKEGMDAGGQMAVCLNDGSERSVLLKCRGHFTS
jgi:hypothetical protein